MLGRTGHLLRHPDFYSGLLQRFDRGYFKGSFIDNTSSRFMDFSDPSSQLVNMTLQLLLVPSSSSSSSYLDANGGIYLLAVGSQGCMTLRLPRTNQMWNGGSTELQMTRATGQPLEPSSCQLSARLFCSISHRRRQCKNQFCSSDLRGIGCTM